MIKEHNGIDSLVSIVMPTYNSEEYVSKSIESVLNQTYANFELLIVDDCSTDSTFSTLKKISDPRVRINQLEYNQGAAVARNEALKMAKGEFIAFIDSDDLWHPEKLSYQINYMKKNNYSFTSTNYVEINESGESTGIIIKARKKLDYEGVLKYCPGNSTIMYNANHLGIFFIPNIRKRNDFVMWLQVIKKAGSLYGLDKNFTYYRVREDSLSINKKSLIKYQWKVYREIEQLPLKKSLFLLFHKIASIILKKKFSKVN